MTDSNGLARFRTAAEEFCGLVEQSAASGAADFLAVAERRLVALYAAALQLEADASSDGDWSARIPHEAWRDIYVRLQTILGPYDQYREIFDPAALGDPSGSIEGGDEPVVASLSDDLADIWRDLRPGLMAWALANERKRGDIAWEWQASFTSHWGQHLVDALRAIHWWRYVHHVDSAHVAPEA